MTAFKAACVQLNSGNDLAANLRAAETAIRSAAASGAQLIMLPEYAAMMDGSGRVMRENSPAEDGHPALDKFRALARETGAWLLVGSLTIKADDERMVNRSYLVSTSGEIAARYDKIHMFDCTLPSGKVIRESSAYRPGEAAVIATTPWGPLGMTICYDLRFPQLYRALAQAGALFLAVPSSFQRETGIAHWHALLQRARDREPELCIRTGYVRRASGQSHHVRPLAHHRPVGKNTGRARRRAGHCACRHRRRSGCQSSRHAAVDRARPAVCRTGRLTPNARDSIRFRHSQHFLSDKAEYQVRTDRRDARNERFAQISLDVEFLRRIPCRPCVITAVSHALNPTSPA